MITKRQIEQEIMQSFKGYPMDFASRIEDCKNEVEIRIYDADYLKMRVSTLSKHFPESAEILEKLLKTSTNDNVNNRVITANVESYLEIFIDKNYTI